MGKNRDIWEESILRAAEIGNYRQLTEVERFQRVDSFFVNGVLYNPEDFMPDVFAAAYRRHLQRDTYKGVLQYA